jgi:mRNA interferase MazF
VKRGEVWWANLPAPAGRRPVVLISRNEAYRVRALVTIAPVTTRIRGIPVEVGVRAEGRVAKKMCGELRQLDHHSQELVAQQNSNPFSRQGAGDQQGNQVCPRSALKLLAS